MEISVFYIDVDLVVSADWNDVDLPFSYSNVDTSHAIQILFESKIKI